MRRLKLVTALSLLAALSVALVLFAVIVSFAASRIVDQRVDERLEERVAAGLDRVTVDATGKASVEAATDPHLTSGSPELYVVQDGRVVLRPTAPLWPEVDVITPARRTVVQDPPQQTRTTTEARRVPIAPADEKVQRVRILAAPVVDAGGEPVAAVVGVANVGSGEDAQQQLTDYMRWTAAALLAAGLLVAVVLARGSFWLVDRAIADHEQFLRDTAHELRAPIATLAAITDAGLSGHESPERALEQAADVLHQTDEVIDDLVALARIEVGRDELHALPLRLDLLIEALVSQRQDDPQVVLTTTPTIVRAQPNLVRRAVGNLIDNAVHHGRIDDPRSEVSVTVARGELTVADRGPGVSPALLSRFATRPHGRRRRYRSGQDRSGLGLATAQWVAAVHGGELGVTNRRDGGARFTLRLPEADEG